MKQLIICMDVGGYTERLRALQDAHPHVIGITPHDRPCVGFTPVTVPDEWLPTAPEIPHARKCWHATGTLALAAIQQLDLQADHFWIVESDCVASQERWQAMLADNADNITDGLFICPRTRQETAWNHWWAEPGVPHWLSHLHLNAIYRVSSAGVTAWAAVAEECRGAFGEIVIGSAIARAGGSLGKINRTQTHLNSQTVKADPARVILNAKLINHPVKSNTYAPPQITRGTPAADSD